MSLRPDHKACIHGTMIFVCLLFCACANPRKLKFLPSDGAESGDKPSPTPPVPAPSPTVSGNPTPTPGVSVSVIPVRDPNLPPLGKQGIAKLPLTALIDSTGAIDSTTNQFSKNILPLLLKHCASCHTPESKPSASSWQLCNSVDFGYQKTHIKNSPAASLNQEEIALIQEWCAEAQK